MRYDTSGKYNVFTIYDKEGRPERGFFFIFSRPAYGKSLLGESIANTFHKAGFTVIFLSDPKGE